MSSTKLSVFNADNVQYRCSCGVYQKISRIYFCRHCLELRCNNCISHEVDSFFCPNCVENIPSAEAKHKKYRCMNCWVCPSCSHTLVPRAASLQVPAPDDPTKTIPKKVYFLVCGFCRWSSRDAGIPDQTTASGSWQDLEPEEGERIGKLVEHFKAITLKEKFEKEKKAVRKSKYMHLVSKSAMFSATRKRSSAFTSSPRDKEIEVKEIVPAEASDEVEELSPSYFDDLCLTSITKLSQRHNDPHFQHEETKQMYPRRMGLLIKQSKRCKVCEHNLIKPEFNPTSIKFKIQLSAFFHVPEIRIMKMPELKYKQPCKLILSLCNPTQHDLSIKLVGVTAADDPEVTAEITPPFAELKLSQRDDTAEFDDATDAQGHKDDPEVVMYRKANKIGICCVISPHSESGPVIAKLLMKYDCTITAIILSHNEPKEPQIVSMEHNIKLHMGEIAPIK